MTKLCNTCQRNPATTTVKTASGQRRPVCENCKALKGPRLYENHRKGKQ